MNSLKTLFGAAAVATNLAGAVEAQDSTLGVEKTINGVEGRTQLYNLPDAVLPNLYIAPEDTPRNPGNRVGQTTKFDSIGTVDQRQMVTHGMTDYNPVLQLENLTTHGTCTATIVTIDGFEAKREGDVVVTAAHCVEIKNPSTEEFVRFALPSEIALTGSYLLNGQVQNFTMNADSVWVNPLYLENKNADIAYFNEKHFSHDVIAEADTAILFVNHPAPPEVVPARMYTFDYAKSLEVSEDIQEAVSNNVQILLAAAGHSGREPYLTVDKHALATYGDYDGMNTLADLAQGASGGPLFLLDKDSGDLLKDKKTNQPTMIAVNSTVIAGTDQARHSYLNTDTLYDVPFLKPEGQEDDLFCTQSGEVLVDALNLRVSPDATAQTIAPDENIPQSQLSKGDRFDVIGESRSAYGQAWVLATTDSGRTAYISANPDYVRIEPKTCISFKP